MAQVTQYQGDARKVLNKDIKPESVQCVVTSPPYWGLRDYDLEPQIWDDLGDCEHNFIPSIEPGGNGNENSYRRDKKAGRKRGRHQPGFCSKCGSWCGSLGLEPTPDLYVKHLVTIFREVKRVLKKDGICFLNLGDVYISNPKSDFGDPKYKGWRDRIDNPNRKKIKDFKSKDLCMMPARVALALQSDGWYLRSQIPWVKRNCMPESCKDRPTTAVEYIYLLSKSRRYYYDHEAVKLPASPDTHARYGRGRSDNHKYADGGPGNQTIAKTFDHIPGVNPKAQCTPTGWQQDSGAHDKVPKGRYYPGPGPAKHRNTGVGWGKASKNDPSDNRKDRNRIKSNPSFSAVVKDVVDTRTRRNSDWFFESWQGLLLDDVGDPLAMVVNTKGTKEVHFATFPEAMVEPCILAGSRIGDIILDPFSGAGTTLRVARRLSRNAIGIELKPEYIEISNKFLKQGFLF